MVNQLTTAQKLRQSVALVKPELLADVPSDYNRRQTFNFLRHKATNYDELLEQHRAKNGNTITPAEVKALTQGAADVIIEALRDENEELITGNANTIFAKFSRKLVELLGLDPGIDLEGIYEATKTLKRSQSQYRSWNERYRRQKNLILHLAKAMEPVMQTKVQLVYKANSKDKLDKLEKELFND